jgi:ABC-2 type transport system ATP-binding protein
MTTRVVISHLCKSFGALEAVKDISFEVEQGEVLGFLGPNGAGKSTTMKMVTGFLTPTSGTAMVCGFDVCDQPLEVKRRIGYLPEGAPSYGEMTPRGFLEFVAGVRGYQGAELRQRAERARGLAQLADVWDQRIETLSKGFKRRVGIAQAILHDPEVLILDEPTDGLDPNQKHEVRDLIREMGKDKVIILSTHILEEVDAVCTRAIIIAHGEVKADGTPAQLHEHAWGGPALTVGVKAATAAEVGALLQGIEGVHNVEALESANGLQRFRVTASPGCDLAAAVGRGLASQPWELDELSPERSGLDRVFRQVTTGGNGA